MLYFYVLDIGTHFNCYEWETYNLVLLSIYVSSICSKKSAKIGNASAVATPRGFATHGRLAPTGPQSAETIARLFWEDEAAYMTEPKWPYWGKPDTQKTEIGHERGSQGSDFDRDWCNPALRFEPGLILQVPERKNGLQIQKKSLTPYSFPTSSFWWARMYHKSPICEEP